jgi:flagellar biosynthesis GTPase FlhF
LVAGALRIGPIAADTGAAVWQGTAAVDLKTMAIDARGTLTARARPVSWSAAPPYIQLAWRGSARELRREVDAGPLVNGLAAVVLTRELERVEAFEADANERLRTNQRMGMERDRRAAAAEAARRAAEAAEQQARAKAQAEAEEAQRQTRLREQAEGERVRAQREQAEAARAREAERASTSDRSWTLPGVGPPTDIRPPAQARPPGG